MKYAISLLICALALIGYLATSSEAAANSPCSGRKGGISHCQGSTFICDDGSVSASKKNCTAYMGGESGGALGLLGSGASQMAPVGAQGECSCRAGAYCIGPRGGHYCFTDTGRKSYLRR
jgi:hypothetical protein